MSCSKLAVFATAAMILVSCTSQPPTSAKAPPFKSVALVTREDIPELTRSETQSEVVEKHVYGGAAVGTIGGAAIGAAACGPIFYGACVAIMSWYGLVAGSAGGAALGLYSYSGLSDTVDLINFKEVDREFVSAEVYGTMILARTQEPG